MTRNDRIVVLAWSLLDAIRQPRTSMSDDRPRRPSPSESRLCGTCDGTGAAADRFGRQTECVSCDGHGRYEIDTYTESRVATTTSSAEPRIERVGCSWCQPSHGREPAGRWETLPRGTGVRGTDRCEHCDGSGWRTLTIAAGADHDRRSRRGELVAWTMHGDWPALHAALEQLRHDDKQAHRAFLADAIRGEIRTAAARRGLDRLSELLPRRLHVPADIRQAYDARQHRKREHERKRQARLGPQARRARDRDIRHARRNGVPADTIAAEHGISESTVRRAS